jgi:protein-disulfide isomerase
MSSIRQRKRGAVPGRPAMAWLPASLVLSALVAMGSAWGAPGDPAGSDPRLGAPFEVRDRPVLGSDKAPITFVEVISFKCPHCREYLEHVYPQLKAQYVDTGKVRVVMINASDDPADANTKIFAIGRCLNKQGQLWSQLDFLFKISGKPPSFYDDLLAQNAAINGDDLAACLQDWSTKQLVAGDFAEYEHLEVHGTPTFFISMMKANGERTKARVDGYEDLAFFQRVFDALLAQP